jgi:hypothetical protein
MGSQQLERRLVYACQQRRKLKLGHGFEVNATSSELHLVSSMAGATRQMPRHHPPGGGVASLSFMWSAYGGILHGQLA